MIQYLNFNIHEQKIILFSRWKFDTIEVVIMYYCTVFNGDKVLSTELLFELGHFSWQRYVVSGLWECLYDFRIVWYMLCIIGLIHSCGAAVSKIPFSISSWSCRQNCSISCSKAHPSSRQMGFATFRQQDRKGPSEWESKTLDYASSKQKTDVWI